MTEGIAYRPARRDELGAAAAVYVRADDELDQRLHGHSLREPVEGEEDDGAAALADLTLMHEDGPDRVWVAVRGDAVVGVAAAAIRERHWHLVYLFVVPEEQGRGVGRGLLDRIHGAGVAAGCDVFTLQASDDPKALTRYLALGLAPGPPSIDLRVTAPAFPPVRWDDGLEPQPLLAEDVAVLETVGDVDRLVRGVRRAQDLRRWLGEGARGALLTRRDTGAPAGYYLVSALGRRGRIGPVAAVDGDWFAAVLGRALAAAGDRAGADLGWRVDVPGENRAAIAPLFAAGFRPHRLSAFFASAPIGRFDRYVFHDEDLL
jgi:GNAT superfamily N-acetyltransferase